MNFATKFEISGGSVAYYTTTWKKPRNHKLGTVYDNVPVTGIKVNKFGSYGKTSWVNCTDPRGFSFRMDLSDMFFDLDIKDRVIQTPVVFLFNNGIHMVPANSPLVQKKDLKNKKGVRKAHLKPSTRYMTRYGKEVTYIGEFTVRKPRRYNNQSYGVSGVFQGPTFRDTDGYFIVFDKVPYFIKEEIGEGKDYTQALLNSAHCSKPVKLVKGDLVTTTHLPVLDKLGRLIQKFKNYSTGEYWLKLSLDANFKVTSQQSTAPPTSPELYEALVLLESGEKVRLNQLP